MPTLKQTIISTVSPAVPDVPSSGGTSTIGATAATAPATALAAPVPTPMAAAMAAAAMPTCNSNLLFNQQKFQWPFAAVGAAGLQAANCAVTPAAASMPGLATTANQTVAAPLAVPPSVQVPSRPAKVTEAPPEREELKPNANLILPPVPTRPSPTPPPVDPTVGFPTPSKQDVMCGRGGATNNHVGNVYWRQLCAKSKPTYLRVPKRAKMQVAKSIVAAVRAQDPPGRFLQKNAKDGLWYDIGDQKAQDKTSQALREGAPELRKKLLDEAKVRRAITEDLQKYPRHVSDLKPETKQYLKQTFDDMNRREQQQAQQQQQQQQAQQQQGFGQRIAPTTLAAAGLAQGAQMNMPGMPNGGAPNFPSSGASAGAFPSPQNAFMASMGVNGAAAATSGMPRQMAMMANNAMQMANQAAAMSNSIMLKERMAAYGSLPAMNGLTMMNSMSNRTMMPSEQAMFEQMAVFRAMEAQAAQTAEKTMETMEAQAARLAEKRCEEIRLKNLQHSSMESPLNAAAKGRATPANKPTKGTKSKPSKRNKAASSAKSCTDKRAASVPNQAMLSAKGPIPPAEVPSAARGAASVPNKSMLSARGIIPTEALPMATTLTRAVTSDDENKAGGASENDESSSPPLTSLKRFVSADDCFRPGALPSVPKVRSSEDLVGGGGDAPSSQSASRERRLPAKKRGYPSSMADRPEEVESRHAAKKAAVDSSSTGGADADGDVGYPSSSSSKVNAAATAISEPFDLLINAAVSKIQNDSRQNLKAP